MSFVTIAWGDTPSTTETINRWVVDALREDPRVRFSNIVVASENGNVTLSGSVFSLAERQFAGLIALKIQGVRRVSNQLTIDTPDRLDSDLVTDIRRKILNSSSMRVGNLTVVSNSGNVMVGGDVRSLPQREQVTLLVSEVQGVRAIQNDIQIVLATTRSDQEISDDVEGAMRRDVYLNTLPIEIFVANGTVVLSGTVGNAYQRERASQEARRVANVVAVKNEIGTSWSLQRGARVDEPRPSNDELKRAVEEELAENLRINASGIFVSAVDGQVVLRGSVDSFSQKELASENVMSVAGALWVSNLLAVRIESRNDGEIAKEVDAILQSDYLLGGQGIVVRVLQGEVTLTGAVHSANEKVHASELSGRIRGVRAINNAIDIGWKPKYRDASLEDRIRARLQANSETRWVVDKIDLRVEGGKVTLTGVVQTWVQWREAARVASLIDGVWAVDNRLTIANANYRWEAWHSDTQGTYFDAYPEYSILLYERRF